MNYDHFRNVDFNLLVAFNILMEERSITGAARRLLVTQPAMTRMVDRLQSMFKDELLVRTREGYKPTERATVIYGQLQQIFPKLESLLNAEQFNPAQASGLFRIEASDWGATVLVPGLICILSDLAPGIQLDVVPRRGGFEGLESNEVDLVLAVAENNADFNPDTLRAEPLLQDKLVCLMRSDHPLAKGRLTLKKYVDAPHAALSQARRLNRRISFLYERQPIVAKALQQLGRRPEARVRVPYFFPLGIIVGKTDLIATLPLHIARQLKTRQTRIVPAPKEFGVATYHQVWRARNDPTPVHAWIREQLRNLAKRVTRDLDSAAHLRQGRMLGV